MIETNIIPLQGHERERERERERCEGIFILIMIKFPNYCKCNAYVQSIQYVTCFRIALILREAILNKCSSSIDLSILRNYKQISLNYSQLLSHITDLIRPLSINQTCLKFTLNNIVPRIHWLICNRVIYRLTYTQVDIIKAQS